MQMSHMIQPDSSEQRLTLFMRLIMRVMHFQIDEYFIVYFVRYKLQLRILKDGIYRTRDIFRLSGFFAIHMNDAVRFDQFHQRSEERRVGKECSAGVWTWWCQAW